MIKKMYCFITSALLVFAFVISLSSCASTAVENDVATLSKYDDAMLWEVNGTDTNGNPSKLYVFGTIHVGDDRLYPLPEPVKNAYESSDRYVAELSTADFGKMVPELINRQLISMQKEATRVKETGKPLLSYFTEEELSLLLKIYGSLDVVEQLALFEPWVLMSGITSYPVLMSGLDANKGIDAYIIDISSKNNKFVEGLDTLDTQLDLLSFGDWDTQLAMTKDLLKELIDNPDSTGQDLVDLYNTYLSFDESKIAELMSAEINDDKADYEDEYNNAMFYDRNVAWADKFDDFLKQGGTTFIFAGTAHFVGEDSVFDIMKKNGTLR